MPRRTPKKRIGVGAKCSVLKRFLHPSRLIQDKYINIAFHDRLSDLIAIRKEVKTIRNKDVTCIVFQHGDFPTDELYAHQRYAKVLEEGAAADIFRDADPGAENDDERQEGVAEGELGEQAEPLEVPALTANADDDIERLRAEGYGVDDDNEPAPENIPALTDDVTDNVPQFHEWGSRPYCNRRLQNRFQEGATMDQNPHSNSRLAWFLKFLPVTYLQNVLIPATNQNLDGKPLDWPEFLRFIGLLLLMATVNTGCDRRSWFEDTEPSEFEGAPYRLNKYMSLYRFESILKSLRYTNIPSPAFKDKFHDVRLLIQSFNIHMSKIFIPSWISCLDESMSPWTSRWTCPGWMFVPRKPHPMGNEYHSICCGESGIMYGIEMVEGKDRPQQLGRPEHGEHGTTAGLLLRLTRCLWFTGKVVILDSGFCVLKALIELGKKGVFASALIKKRRYWPKHVAGEEIKNRFCHANPGFTERLPGTWDGIAFDIFAMKEPDYVLMMMSTYGAMIQDPREKVSYRTVPDPTNAGQTVRISFKYQEVIGNHYRYRGAVDEHNSKRHDGGGGAGISLEKSWKTSRWENRVFAFVLAICEVNAYLARIYFGKETEVQLEFKKKLCFELITHLDDVRNEEAGNTPKRVRTRRSANHRLIRAPPYSKFLAGKWEATMKRKYQAFQCGHAGCKKRIRTVCSCSKHIWRCDSCFATHFAEEIMSP
jgi:hypothetical protein